MPETVTEPLDPPCYVLFSKPGIEECQSLGPDPLLPRARGRFANGSSGNPRGRPPGIPNPRRRVPDLVARPLSAQGLSNLLDRQPYLLRPLAAQLLPPPLASIDPAERFGIDLSSLRTLDNFQQALRTAWAAVSHGEITPGEGARIARRMRARLRALRRFARLVKPLSAHLGGEGGAAKREGEVGFAGALESSASPRPSHPPGPGGWRGSTRVRDNSSALTAGADSH
jgi:hypothetical protein